MISWLSLFAAVKCPEREFFNIPVWYRYLNDGRRMDYSSGTCNFTDQFKFPTDLSLIVLGILDIALHIAGLVAVGFVIYGAIKFITSQGDPEGSKRARQTIINALIGLVIALFSSAFVAFIGSRIGGVNV